MAGYRSGKVFTGVSTGLNVDQAKGDELQKIGEQTVPKKRAGYKTYKAKVALPLNMASPKGKDIVFDGHYFSTKNKDVIAFLDEQEDYCELC